MPGSKSCRREDKNRRSCNSNSNNKLFSIGDRAKSFHGRSTGAITETLVRPRTVPDLLHHVSSFTPGTAVVEEVRVVRLSKVLLNVTVHRSLGAVQVLLAPESTVGELIVATLKQYNKEGRKPVLGVDDAVSFDLHYSQFSLESLIRDEKLIKLGSRNFFLFPRTSTPITESNNSGSGSAGSLTTSSCSEQVESATKITLPWLKFLF